MFNHIVGDNRLQQLKNPHQMSAATGCFSVATNSMSDGRSWTLLDSLVSHDSCVSFFAAREFSSFLSSVSDPHRG
jgi:hypothetical protein